VAVLATAASRDSKRTETVPRDISGVMSGTMTFEFYDWPPAPPELAPYSIPIRSITEVAGTLTHLGAATMHTDQRPYLDPNGTVTDGHFTITAANGDTISGTYEGTTEAPDPVHRIGHAIFVISGGTGRFAYATGTIKATGFLTIAVPLDIGVFEPLTYVLEGTVSY
jgi:hypothetical protein